MSNKFKLSKFCLFYVFFYMRKLTKVFVETQHEFAHKSDLKGNNLCYKLN